MSNSWCSWVQARLPLLVGDDREGETGEHADLRAEERRTIERHLLDCEACRKERLALSWALDALETVGRERPRAMESFWPQLEERIARVEEAAAHRGEPCVDRLDPVLRMLNDERPLHHAWAYDGLRGWTRWPARLAPAAHRGAVLGLSSAAAILAACLVWWQFGAGASSPPVQGEQQVVIVPEAAPAIPDPDDAPADVADNDDTPDHEPVASRAETPSHPATAAGIAHATPHRTHAGSRAGGAVETTGIQAPDPRDAKPVY